jgi:hypothetical protein
MMMEKSVGNVSFIVWMGEQHVRYQETSSANTARLLAKNQQTEPEVLFFHERWTTNTSLRLPNLALSLVFFSTTEWTVCSCFHPTNEGGRFSTGGSKRPRAAGHTRAQAGIASENGGRRSQARRDGAKRCAQGGVTGHRRTVATRLTDTVAN